MALSDRIAKAIEASEKTKAEISRACGVTNAAVTQWLDGTTKSLKAEKAFALAQATGFRADWLLHGKGPRLQAEPDAPYWPFPKIPLKRFTDLDPDDQGYVQRRLIQAIEECEKAIAEFEPDGSSQAGKGRKSEDLFQPATKGKQPPKRKAA